MAVFADQSLQKLYESMRLAQLPYWREFTKDIDPSPDDRELTVLIYGGEPGDSRTIRLATLRVPRSAEYWAVRDIASGDDAQAFNLKPIDFSGIVGWPMPTHIGVALGGITMWTRPLSQAEAQDRLVRAEALAVTLPSLA